MFRFLMVLGALCALCIPVAGVADDVRVVSLTQTSSQGAPYLLEACVDGRTAKGAFLGAQERIETCTRLKEQEAAHQYEALLGRARAFMSAQNWANAEADFSAALKVRPNSETALFERGQVRFLYLENTEAALSDFETVALLAPDTPQHHMMLALAAIDRAKALTDADVSTLVSTARGALETYLLLTDGTDDVVEITGRQAAEVVLSRLSQIE